MLFRELLPQLGSQRGQKSLGDLDVFENSLSCWAHLISKAEVQWCWELKWQGVFILVSGIPTDRAKSVLMYVHFIDSALAQKTKQAYDHHFCLLYYRNCPRTMRTMLQSVLCQKMAIVSVSRSEYLESQGPLNEHMFSRKLKVKFGSEREDAF